jgi:hypothetical protein
MPVRLGHYTGKTEYRENPAPGVLWESSMEYLVTPLELPRPAEGVAPVHLTCPACGARITFELASAREVHRTRIRNLLIGLVLAAVVLVVVLTDLRNTQAFVEPGAVATTLGIVFAVAFFGAAFMAFLLIHRSLRSEFHRGVIVPNMAYWLARNNSDSMRLGYYKKRAGTTEMSGHKIFPPRGKLEGVTSL